ncbi:MAG: type II toxin-antitoxin system VapC family toxin [Planctomycetes bacterium]|nr:type II toxin-antitoxin system VapC family toxin [Planctomycetota bacterium]
MDANPLIYAFEGHPLAEPFRPIIEGAERGDYELVVTPVTLAELLGAPIRSGREALIERYYATLTTAPFRLRELDAEIAVSAARLRVRYGLKLPDAIQLATGLHDGCFALVSRDAHFARVSEIPVIDGSL